MRIQILILGFKGLTLLLPSNVAMWCITQKYVTSLLACFQYCSMGATYWLCYGLIIIIFLAKLFSIVILNIECL